MPKYIVLNANREKQERVKYSLGWIFSELQQLPDWREPLWLSLPTPCPGCPQCCPTLIPAASPVTVGARAEILERHICLCLGKFPVITSWPQLYCKLFSELIFFTPEKAWFVFLLFVFLPVWTSFSFHWIFLYLVDYTTEPAVTKSPSTMKASKDGLGSVVLPELIAPRQITYSQFLETYLSFFPIRRRSNTDFSCAKYNIFWVDCHL